MYCYDASMYNILSTHEQEGEEEIHIYVDADIDASPLTLRMSMCYLGKPNDSRSPGTEYFKGHDDDVENNNKVILVVKEQDLNLNKDDFDVGVDLCGDINAINCDVDVYIVDSVVSGDTGANVDVYSNVKGVVRGVMGDDLDVDCSGDVSGVLGVVLMLLVL